MRTIMVPTNGSDASNRAVPIAAQLARAQGAEILLIRVLQTTSLDYANDDAFPDPDVYASVLKAVEEKAQADIARLARDLEAQSIKARTMTPRGFPSATLLDTEQDVRPDLVVMATHGRAGIARFALGSITDRFVREGSAPVLLVRRDTAVEQPIRSAVVLLDGSGVAESMLPVVEQLIGRPLESITLYRAVDAAEDRGPAETYLDGVAARLNPLGVEVKALVDVGDPRVTIERVGREHDLVMLSTHGRGGFDRLRHGSVAEAVVREVPNPVLLVRAPSQ